MYETPGGENYVKVYLNSLEIGQRPDLKIILLLTGVPEQAKINISGVGAALHTLSLPFKDIAMTFKILERRSEINVIEEEKARLIELYM